jgi:RNA polymerase sigma-70 factor (ECF subfamily)
MTDKPTVERFKDGDRQAFEDIYSEYRQTLIDFLQKYDVENAEDIVEDTFIRLWDNRTQIQPDMNLFNYACTIALNIVKNNFAHNNVVQIHAFNQADTEQSQYSPEEELIAQDLLQHINNYIKTKFTEKQQEIFNLRRIQGFTYKEITEKLGIKESTIESVINHINKELREYLKKI